MPTRSTTSNIQFGKSGYGAKERIGKMSCLVANYVKYYKHNFILLSQPD